jgi:hypothetical protein
MRPSEGRERDLNGVQTEVHAELIFCKLAREGDGRRTCC